MPTIFISAGELSGDRYGGHLIRELLSLQPDIHIFGMGHTQMAAAGATIDIDLTDVATIGFIEPVKHILRFAIAYKKIRTLFMTRQPDLVVLIDFQGFHMQIARLAKKMGIPVAYYIAPQEWQWGTDRGGRNVIDHTTKILSIFPEEHAFWTRLGGNSTLIGHPLLDTLTPDISPENFDAIYGTRAGDIISIFPGSRRQEISLVLPILLESATQIMRRHPSLQIVVSIADPPFHASIQRMISAFGLNATVYTGDPQALIRRAKLSLACSGTITLYHTILGTPCISAYRLGLMSYQVAKWLIAKRFMDRVTYIALPNILAKSRISPEFFQSACQPEKISHAVLHILENPSEYDSICAAYAQVTQKLGQPGATHRAAAELLKLISIKQ